METAGLRAITKELVEGNHLPYEYCFEAPAMLAHETDDEQIMTPKQYEELWNSDLEDLCYDFEDDWDSYPEKRKELSKIFIDKIRIIYETIMIA